jgi:hypothetical protein
VTSGKSPASVRVSCARQEGRFAIVTNVGYGMRWTLAVRKTSAWEADGEVVWSRRPDAGVNTATTLTRCAGDGDNKARFTRESTKETVKTNRAGSAGMFGGPVVTCLRAFLFLHARLRAS